MGKAGFFKAELRAFNRLLLNIKGKHAAAGTYKTAQKLGVPAVSGCTVYAETAGLDVTGDKFMGQAESVERKVHKNTPENVKIRPKICG